MEAARVERLSPERRILEFYSQAYFAGPDGRRMGVELLR